MIGIPSIFISITKCVKSLWEIWNIRGSILLSLFLQVVLTFVAPIRKSSRKMWVILFIWLAYLLANAAANFAVGLISNSQRYKSDGEDTKKSDGEDTKNMLNESSELLAFWAPFLLLHLGGPDTITAFALIDNKLWLRQLFGLFFQAGAILYVFFQSFPNKRMGLPTMLMFVAGIFKCVERTRALYLASLDKFRDSMLKNPDPGPNYAKLMEEYNFKKEAKLPTTINMTPEPDKEVKASDIPPKEGPLNHLEVVHYAYKYYKIFKGLVVDLILSFRERDESREFFYRRTAKEALRVIEVELNFIYGTLYTKEGVVHSRFGYILRFLAFGTVLATLGIFYFKEDKEKYFRGVEINITYTLLLGAIALDVIAFLMLILSDRTIANSINDPVRPRYPPIAAIFRGFLSLMKPIWRPCKGKCRIKTGGNVCVGEHQLLATPLLFRRWSGSVQAHNLIRFCLESNSNPIHEFPSLGGDFFENIFCALGINKLTQKISTFCAPGINKLTQKISNFCAPGINKLSKCFNGVRHVWGFIKKKLYKVFRFVTRFIEESVDEMVFVSREPFSLELWEFIFEELKNKAEFAHMPEIAKRISSARGDLVLEDVDCDQARSMLLTYMTAVPYDESLLLWHIATDLCYHAQDIVDGKKVVTTTEDELGQSSDEKKPKANDINNYRQFSKILSDYMLYLLVFQPTMMPAFAGIGKIRFGDTVQEAKRFFKRQSLKANQDEEACKQIMGVNTEVSPVTVKGDRSKSVLFDASMLAKELEKLGDEKWKLMSRVWVELVSYAASNCRGNMHAKQVSKGGELVSFVWLLMYHFGLGDQFQIKVGRARAKLIVDK